MLFHKQVIYDFKYREAVVEGAFRYSFLLIRFTSFPFRLQEDYIAIDRTMQGGTCKQAQYMNRIFNRFVRPESDCI